MQEEARKKAKEEGTGTYGSCTEITRGQGEGSSGR